MWLRISGTAVLVLTLIACAPQTANLQAQLPKPALEDPVTPAQVTAWCGDFLPPPLTSLIHRALRQNRDLGVAAARLREAEAVARAAGATLLPSLALEGSASRGRQPFLTEVPDNVPFELETIITRYRLGLAAQYELDLWQRLANRREAAALQADAAAEELRTARVTLAAQVAEGWFDLVAQHQVSELLKAQSDASTTLLELTQLRFAQGQTQGLDLVQQRQFDESLRGRLVLAQGQQRVASQRLATLLGEPPDAPIPASDRLPLPDPLPLHGIPANLLELRPDLAMAGARLAAADREAAAAVADRLPALQLSAQAFGEANSLNQIFDQLFWNLMANVQVTLFDNGRLEAQATAAEAQVEAALESYAQTYLTALSEVGNALVLEQRQRDYLASLRTQVEAADRALSLAREGYLQGALDYLRVLDAQQSLYESRQTLVDGRRQLLSYRVQLCRALGHAPEVAS